MNVELATWQRALSLVNRGVTADLVGGPASGITPVMDALCFDAEYAWAYNGGQAVQTKLASPIKGAVIARPVLKLLGSYTSEKIQVETHPDTAEITFSSPTGSSKARLPSLPPESFILNMPEFMAKLRTGDKILHQVAITPDIVTAFTKVLVSVGNDPVDVSQIGVTLAALEKQEAVYSTDNLSVSRHILPPRTLWRDPDIPQIIFPKPFIERFVDFYKQLIVDGSDTACTLYYLHGDDDSAKPTTLVADFGSTQLYSSLLSTPTKYDFKSIFDRFMPPRSPFTYPVPPGLVNVLDRALILQHGDAYQRVNLQIEDSQLVVMCQGSSGSMREEIDLKISGARSKKFVVDAAIFKRACQLGHNIAFLDETVMLFDDAFVHLVAHYGE